MLSPLISISGKILSAAGFKIIKKILRQAAIPEKKRETRIEYNFTSENKETIESTTL